MDSDRYEINFESQNGKIRSEDNTDNYATSPSPSTFSSTENTLSNEVSTALPSSITETVLKLAQPEGTVYTPSISTASSTETAHIEATSEVTSPSPVTNASPSSSTQNIEEDQSTLRHIIHDPNLPQSPLFVSSSERFVSTTTERVPMKVYPSTPGTPTTMSNVFYVNAQSNYNSTTAMLEGFESYLKDYLNANEVKSNDIDSNFKVISDKSELDKLIKNSGQEYEVIKLSDIMAEKKRKESERLAFESTTPGYIQTDNIYTQVPSTFSTRSMDTTGTTGESLRLMKYFVDANNEKEEYKSSSDNFENRNLNSFVDKNNDPDSATSQKSSTSQQFVANYGEKTFNSNADSNPNKYESSYNMLPLSNEEKRSASFDQPSQRFSVEPNYSTRIPNENTASSVTVVPLTVTYPEEAKNVENYREILQSERKDQDGRNQYSYYQNVNVPNNQGQEEIYFKELQVDNSKVNKNAQLLYSNLPLQYMTGVNPNVFYSQLQSKINQQRVYADQSGNNLKDPSSYQMTPPSYNQRDLSTYHTIPTSNMQQDLSTYHTIPFPYNPQPNVEQYRNEGSYRSLETNYRPNTINLEANTPPSTLYDKPIIVAEVNNTNEEPKIVTLSNGETGHMVKTPDNVSQNSVSAVTISDIEAAKVDQLIVTTPKTVSKKDIENNKLDEGLIEKQLIHKMPSYTTTIEVFKSVPVEQYNIPDVEPSVGAGYPQKPLPQDFIKQFQQIQINQQPYQDQAPRQNYVQGPNVPVQKTRLQPVYPSQSQRQQLFRPDSNYFREQKYYTDEIEETKVPYNSNQKSVAIPLNYGLKEYPKGNLEYRTPLSHQIQSIQQYGVPQYSMYTSPLSPESMSVIHPSYSISVNPLPLHQIQQQMVSNSVPYASQFYPNYIPSDDPNISQPNLINPGPTVNPQVKYYQPEKSISSEPNNDPYHYPKPLHNPLEYPAKPAYNHKTRLVPVAHHFHIPRTILHLIRTPYKSTLSKLSKSAKYNPNESHYLREMYNYAPQYPKENFNYEGQQNSQFTESLHYDGRSKHAPFRPSFPMYDSVYPPMAYYETQYMAPTEQVNNNNYNRRPHVRSIRRPNPASGNMMKLTVEYGGFKPPMVPSTEIKEGDVQTSSTEK